MAFPGFGGDDFAELGFGECLEAGVGGDVVGAQFGHDDIVDAGDGVEAVGLGAGEFEDPGFEFADALVGLLVLGLGLGELGGEVVDAGLGGLVFGHEGRAGGLGLLQLLAELAETGLGAGFFELALGFDHLGFEGLEGFKLGAGAPSSALRDSRLSGIGTGGTGFESGKVLLSEEREIKAELDQPASEKTTDKHRDRIHWTSWRV